MSHYITVPLNENGVITDPYIQEELKVACSQNFGIADVFLYSHGWWTTGMQALADYNRFSVNFADKTLEIAAIEPPPLPRLRQTKAFGVGLHWPSMLSEDTDSLVNRVEITSFYTMEKRADTVGHNGVYAILRMAIEANQAAKTPLRFHFLGHSFGCKVVCAALQEIADDEVNGITKALDINVVLIQAAFENDGMEVGQEYESIPTNIFNARVLVTRSDRDKALQEQFKTAKMINIFAQNRDRVALGADGPTDAVKSRFGGCYDLKVTPGFKHGDFQGKNNRLVCADITPLHDANEANGTYKGDQFGGHHSDINIPELYELIAAFLFQ
jgi:predicted alpha/beta hydrolase family esterase